MSGSMPLSFGPGHCVTVISHLVFLRSLFLFFLLLHPPPSFSLRLYHPPSHLLIVPLITLQPFIMASHAVDPDVEGPVQTDSELSSIMDAKERRRVALARIDQAKFGWYHVRAVIVAGVGFFTDSYDIFAINLAVSMLGVVYWQDAKTGPGKLPSSADTAIKVATSGGTVIGQLFFGWLADRIGRKRMYGIELMIIILATLAQSLSSDSPGMSIVGVLIFWRVIMGIGIGGDYPLSSIITSE